MQIMKYSVSEIKLTEMAFENECWYHKPRGRVT